MEEAQQYWRTSTQRVYDQGDKNGKLLYWLALYDQPPTIVPAIKDCTGPSRSQTEEIAGVFADYYRALYAAQPRLGDEEILVFLEDIALPSLSRNLNKSLNKPISLNTINIGWGKHHPPSRNGRQP